MIAPQSRAPVSSGQICGTKTFNSLCQLWLLFPIPRFSATASIKRDFRHENPSKLRGPATCGPTFAQEYAYSAPQ